MCLSCNVIGQGVEINEKNVYFYTQKKTDNFSGRKKDVFIFGLKFYNGKGL